MLPSEIRARAAKLEAEQKARIEKEKQRLEKERILKERQRQRELAREEEKRQKKLQELAAQQAVRYSASMTTAMWIVCVSCIIQPVGTSQLELNHPSASDQGHLPWYL